MRKFKLAVYKGNDRTWCFRWWNVHCSDPQAATIHQGLFGPCNDRQDAETEKKRFMETEKQKYPWTVFELAE